MFLKSTFLILFIVPLVLSAQRDTQYSLITTDLYPTESINTFDIRERSQILQSFLYDEWMDGQVIFSGNIVSKQVYSLKYDVLNQQLDILMDGNVFEVPKNKIVGFLLQSPVGPAGQKFVLLKEETQPERIILEVIVQGKYSLLEYHFVERLRSNYVAALDAGDRNEKLVNRESLFFVDDKQRLQALPKKNKEALRFFNKYPVAKQYLKDNKVNFKNMEQVKELVFFMNKMGSVKKS